MEGNCSACEHPLQGRPITQLLCQHSYHTQCLFTNLAVSKNVWDFVCVTCHERLLPDFVYEHQDMEEEEDGEEEQEETGTVATNETTGAAGTRVINLYNTNRVFRRDIKTYAHAFSSISRPKREFKALIKEKRTELNEPYALMKAQYEGLYNVRKQQLLESEAYKNYKRADARMRRLYTSLGQKYRVYSYHFHALSQFPGLKRLKGPSRWRYYDRPNRLIHRGLRLRLPYW